MGYSITTTKDMLNYHLFKRKLKMIDLRNIVNYYRFKEYFVFL
jgi:hypothetical protein